MTKISSLKGWTVAAVIYSAGYYTLTLVKGDRKTKAVQIAADEVFDDAGRLENDLEKRR